jgi:N-acylneuraminate cytidylyltransferase
MIRSSQVIAIIPARGGSRGIPRKNLAILAGRTLLERAIDVARRVRAIDRIIVSTDDPEIGAAARAAGVEVHDRPRELATDRSKVIDAIRHLCDTMVGAREVGDALMVLLEPTCPLRSPEDVTACIELLAAGNCDSVATFTEAATHPWRAWRMVEGRPVHFVDGANPWLPRQSLPPAFQLSGGAYAFWRDGLRAPTEHLLSGRIGAVVLPPERSLDIDGALDLELAEAVLRRL